MISIKNLGKAYNQRIVLNIGELTINKGEIFGLVGNNGAGKTTLFRLILDLIRADRGEVISGELPVSKSEHWKAYTASYLDEGFLIDYLTPEEFFYFVGSTYNLTKRDVDDKLASFQGFFNGEVLGMHRKFIRDFSKGNKQKIGIVSALIIEPEVILLDEPFNGLDPTSQILLKRILVDFNKKYGTTIVISSHDLNHITEICQRIALMEKGAIIKDLQSDGNILAELESYFAADKVWEL
ncbi:MAG: ABC transporter ATP-binding protein [Bacteroidota bacterium]|nr:ABC transporter ATP-binding protein [Bacteroidota bacterium]